MPAPLSPNLRAALAAHVAHGIDAIDARAIVRACWCEPDVNAALEAIREEFGPCFTQSGRQCFERAVSGRGIDIGANSAPGVGAAGRASAPCSDIPLWRAELEREQERKRHAFLLGAVFRFPAVSAAAVVLAIEDELRLASLEAGTDPASRRALEPVRAEELVNASQQATHRLMQMLASREPEPEASTWILSTAITATDELRRGVRARGEAVVKELSRKAHPHRHAQADALFAQVMLRLAPLVQGN